MYERSTTASRREERQASTRYIHVACRAYMVPNPKHTAENPLPPHMRFLPFVEPGRTYNVGRNAAKRAKRAAAKAA
jgi:hypothetical protein